MMTFVRRKQQQGFSLIESLIAVFVFSFGTLKYVELHISGTKSAHDNLLRSQANLLVADIMDRMRGNYLLANDGAYRTAFDANTTHTTDCNTASCSQNALMDWDISQWKEQVANNLPQGQAAINSAMVNGIRVYSVSIRFTNRDNDSDSVILEAAL